MHKKISIYFIIILNCILVQNSFSQATNRVELPVLNNMEAFTINLKNNGLMVLIQAGKTEFMLKKYDINLVNNWSINGNISANLDFVSHTADNKNVYLLFSKYRSNFYEIIKVEFLTGLLTKYQVYSIDQIEISDFKAINNVALIAGRVKKAAVVMHTDFDTKKTKILPSIGGDNTDLQSIESDLDNNLFTLTYASGRSKDYQLILKSINLEGEIQTEIQLDPNDEYAMLNGKMNILAQKDRILFGTYGFKKTIDDSRGPYSQGIYINKIENNELNEPIFYDFGDFKSFFNHLSKKQQAKELNRIQSKKKKGKDYKINERIMVHDIIEKNGQYIMLAEAFKPEYRNNNNFNNGIFDPYGLYSPFASPFFNPYRWGYGNMGLYSPYSNYYGYRNMGNREVFDSWNYSHAIVAVFDKQGKLQWDQSIDLKNIKSQKLTEKVKLSAENDTLVLSYINNGEIFSKAVKNGETIKELSKKQIETEKEGDNIKKSSEENIEFWYGNYFYTSGIQRISNNADGRRNVFYINKISL